MVISMPAQDEWAAEKIKGSFTFFSSIKKKIFLIVYKYCCKHLLAISKVLEALEDLISLISIQNWKRRTQRRLTGKVNFAAP